MDQIEDFLYIGDLYDARNVDKLVEERITAVLNLAQEVISTQEPVKIINDNINDGYNNSQTDINRVVNTGVELINEGHNLLVNCQLGESRSVAVATGIYAEVKDISFQEAYEVIREEKDSSLNPHPDLIDKVLKTTK